MAARLDLARYDKPAPFEDTTPVTKLVKIPMSQHIGAPATPVVSVGDQVAKGQLIGEPKDGLSVAIHCSIDGVVQKVTDRSSSKRKVRSIKKREKNYGQSNWYGRMHNSIYWF